MRLAFFLYIVFSIIHFPLVSVAQDAKNSPEDARAAIELTAQAYVIAFNAEDASSLSQLWSESAVYVLPDNGEQIVGRKAIRQMFLEMFKEEGAGRLSVTVDSIRFLTENVAIETGISQLIASDGTIAPTRYSAIHVRKDGKWLLDSISDTDLATEGENSGPMAEMQWMVGEWVDAAEESTIETVCQWTKNRNFITRTFRVSAPGTDDLEGTQVVGWDPVNRAFRSWVFDSDGGFSKGNWTRKGESWVVESTGYIAQGQPSASIQVFSEITADSFTWQSFGRRVGDARQPNIGETKVVRKQQ
ncbi:MAG: hypothetical protein ACI814_004257 [Mariniblastus sp.]|jgi:uncharacterized protein (TIGR02246 family)